MRKVTPADEAMRPVAPQLTVFEHEEVVTTCSFSPEGLLAVGDGANKMTVYNLKTGTTEHVFEHEGAVRTCSFSAEGLLAVSDQKKITDYN